MPLAVPPRLGSYYLPNGRGRPVYGRALKEGKGFELFIDFDSVNDGYQEAVGDGAAKGQRFEVYLSADGGFGSGLTEWQGREFGVVLKQESVPFPHHADNTEFSQEK